MSQVSDNSSTLGDRERLRILKEASATRDIKNLMATRAFYHAALRHDLEMTLFSNRPDISWGQNHGFFVGRESIEKYYVTWHIQRIKEIYAIQELSSVSEEENHHALARGAYAIHALTNPIICVADDLASAKAVWYSPGFVIGSTLTTFSASWMFEHYSVDLVFEQGNWKFLHICVYTDLYIPFGTCPTRPSVNAVEEPKRSLDGVGNEGVNGPPSENMSDVPRPDVEKDFYDHWHEDRFPSGPTLPVPYVTLNIAPSYGPGKFTTQPNETGC